MLTEPCAWFEAAAALARLTSPPTASARWSPASLTASESLSPASLRAFCAAFSKVTRPRAEHDCGILI